MFRIGSIRKVTVIKVVLVVLGLFLVSAGWSSPGEAASPIQMKFASCVGSGHPLTPSFRELLKELAEASNGSVAIAYHDADVLGKAAENLDLVTEGLADMVVLTTTYTPAQFPMTALMELPFFTTGSQASFEVANAFLEKKLIDREFEPNKLLIPIPTPPLQLFSNKEITKIEDFKGLRIFGMGPVMNKTLQALGAQGVAMSGPDVYLALERKTLDAAPVSWAASVGWKWVEVVKHPIDISIMGGYVAAVVINKKSWSKLSPEVQAAWTKICEKYGPRFAAVFDSAESAGKKVWTDAGKKIVTFPPEEKERMSKVLMPVWQDWFDRMEKAGKPGKEMYKTYVEVMKKRGEPVVMKVPGLYKD